MGLQSFNTNREHAVGDVKSRKNIENLTIPEDAWRQVISYANGGFPVGITEDFTKEELKCVIKLYDSEIDSDSYFYGSDEDAVEDTREDLVDVLKEWKEEEDEADEASE